MVQLEGGSNPHGPGCCGGMWPSPTARRQVQGTAEATASPGPQDVAQQLRWPSAATDGHELCGTV